MVHISWAQLIHNTGHVYFLYLTKPQPLTKTLTKQSFLFSFKNVFQQPQPKEAGCKPSVLCQIYLLYAPTTDPDHPPATPWNNNVALPGESIGTEHSFLI